MVGRGGTNLPCSHGQAGTRERSKDEELLCPRVDIASSVMQEGLVKDFIAEVIIWNLSKRAGMEKHYQVHQQLEEKLVFLLQSLQNDKDYA